MVLKLNQSYKNLIKKKLNIKIDNIEYKIPNFLINKNFTGVNSNDVLDGLNFSRNLLNNKFFYPNNIRLPYSRILLKD